MVSSKILWNSVISTDDARFAGADIKNMYLATPLDRYEYMKMPIALFPQDIIEHYGLNDKVLNGYVYMEIRKGMYGLPQAGIRANKLLKECLARHGYFEQPHTPGLWKHVSRPVWFNLCVDDFGIKYVGREHLQHLYDALRKETYEIVEDVKGDLLRYCLKVELRETLCRSLHGQLCNETNDKIWPRCAYKTTTLPIFV